LPLDSYTETLKRHTSASTVLELPVPVDASSIGKSPTVEYMSMGVNKDEYEPRSNKNETRLLLGFAWAVLECAERFAG
jgi:hypothetical protein